VIENDVLLNAQGLDFRLDRQGEGIKYKIYKILESGSNV